MDDNPSTPKRPEGGKKRLIILLGFALIAIVSIFCVPSLKGYFLLSKGDCEMLLGLKQQALDDYQTAVQICPQDEVTLSKTASSAEDLEEQETAIGYFNTLSSLSSPSARLTAASHLARIHNLRKEYDDALKWSEQWIDLSPNSARAYYAKGTALAGLRKDDEAISAMDKSIQLDPSSTAATDRDMLQQKTREIDKAADSILADPVLENKGSDYDALIRDIMRLLMAGEYQKAQDASTKAIQLEANNPGAHFLRGWIHYQDHEWSPALQDMTRAQQLAGTRTIKLPLLGTGQVLPPHIEDSEILFYQGCIHLFQKDYKVALQCLNKAIAIAPLSKFYEERAKIYLSSGDQTRAKLDFAQAKKLAGPGGGPNVRLREPLESILAP